MKTREILVLLGLAVAMQVPLLLLLPAGVEKPGVVDLPPPPPPAKPVIWPAGQQSDSDRVPIQIVTMADGQAFFVVGTDTAPWTPRVWLFDPATSKWVQQ